MFPIPLQKTSITGNSLVVQWLGLCVLTAKGWGSVPGPGTKISQAPQWGQKKKRTSIIGSVFVLLFFLTGNKAYTVSVLLSFSAL